MMSWVARVAGRTSTGGDIVHHLAMRIVATSPNARVPWRRRRRSSTSIHSVTSKTRPADASYSVSANSAVGVVVARAWITAMVCMANCMVMVAAVVAEDLERDQSEDNYEAGLHLGKGEKRTCLLDRSW